MSNTDSAPLSVQYSVMVPLHNEEELFTELYSRLKKTMDGLGSTYEMIFVDDGSMDSTPAMIRQTSLNDKNAVGVFLSRNFGQQQAVIAGINYSIGKELIMMDGDLQDPPEFIPDLIRKKREGYNVVYAVKEKRKESFVRKALTDAFYRTMHFMCKTKMPAHAGIFSIIDRKIGTDIIRLPENNKYISGLRAYMGYRQVGVPYNRAPRRKGKEKSLFSLFRMGLNALFSFSIFPIRFSNFVALATIFLTLAIDLYLVASHGEIFENTTAFLLLALFQLQIWLVLILLVFTAEYVGRIHEQAKFRTDYYVESVIRNGNITSEI